MINYGRIKSSIYPSEFEVTDTSVIIASNIEEYSQDFDGQIIHGYEYDYIVYDKDEYLTTIALENAHAITELQDELEATKIILGVE